MRAHQWQKFWKTEYRRNGHILRKKKGQNSKDTSNVKIPGSVQWEDKELRWSVLQGMFKRTAEDLRKRQAGLFDLPQNGRYVMELHESFI